MRRSRPKAPAGLTITDGEAASPVFASTREWLHPLDGHPVIFQHLLGRGVGCTSEIEIGRWFGTDVSLSVALAAVRNPGRRCRFRSRKEPDLAYRTILPASPNREYAVGLARALGGAIIFSLPLLMTMEMWWFGFTLDRTNLLLFGIVNLLMLVGLSRVSGFQETHSRSEDLLDALAAYGVAAAAAAAILWLFGIIGAGMSADEICGKIAIQAFPASFGAMIANKQLGMSDEAPQQERWRASYVGQLFVMTAGALFLAFNVAPTEEMVLISYRMSALQAGLTVLLSILLLHAFVYSVGFAGQEKGHERGFFATFIHYTLAGYGIAVVVSLYLLWTFGRTAGVDIPHVASMTAALAFPGAVGAAIARLVV